MDNRNDDISLSLVKAKLSGFLPDVSDNEVGYLGTEAQRLYAGDKYPESNDITLGESTIGRRDCSVASVSITSQSMRFTYFTATKTEQISQIQVPTAATAAAATPTLIRIGIYSVASNGDLTLVASTANDTTLFATVSTVYTKALEQPFVKIRGQRYAVGILIVTGVATPVFYGITSILSAIAAVEPRISGALSAQNDLPSSVLNSSLSNSGTNYYIALIP